MDLATRFSQHPLVPVIKYAWHTWPPILNSSAQGFGCPSPRGSSLYYPDILAICPFCTFILSWLLQLVPLSLKLPLPSYMAQFSLVMSTLDSPRCPCLWLCSLKYLQQTFSSTKPKSSHVLSFPLISFLFKSSLRMFFYPPSNHKQNQLLLSFKIVRDHPKLMAELDSVSHLVLASEAWGTKQKEDSGISLCGSRELLRPGSMWQKSPCMEAPIRSGMLSDHLMKLQR